MSPGSKSTAPTSLPALSLEIVRRFVNDREAFLDELFGNTPTLFDDV